MMRCVCSSTVLVGGVCLVRITSHSLCRRSGLMGDSSPVGPLVEVCGSPVGPLVEVRGLPVGPLVEVCGSPCAQTCVIVH